VRSPEHRGTLNGHCCKNGLSVGPMAGGPLTAHGRINPIPPRSLPVSFAGGICGTHGRLPATSSPLPAARKITLQLHKSRSVYTVRLPPCLNRRRVHRRRNRIAISKLSVSPKTRNTARPIGSRFKLKSQTTDGIFNDLFSNRPFAGRNPL